MPKIRSIKILDLPFDKSVVILHPELTIVRLADRETLDIGSLCYLKRSSAYRNRVTPGKLVDISTLDSKRISKIRSLLIQISNDVEHSGDRIETIRDRYSRFTAFMNWADNNGHSNVLANVNEGRTTVQEYFDHLRDRVSRNSMKLNSAVRQQAPIVNVMEKFFAQEFLSGVRLLHRTRADTTSTSPPSEEDQGKVLSLSTAIFEGIHDFIANNHPYPFKLELPAFLSLPNDCLWIFPGSRWFHRPEVTDARSALPYPAYYYNFTEGRLSTPRELAAFADSRAGGSDIARQALIKQGQQYLDRANSDPQNTRRRQMASLAASAFELLFIAETGMNWSSLAALTWAQDFSIKSDLQGFRTVKWRAGGKIVSFQISVAFVPLFKKYLDIRDYLLRGTSYDRLFFSVGSNSTEQPYPRLRGHTTHLWLKRIYPDLPKITSKRWRAAKSDWLLRNTDIGTAAAILQNSEATVMRSYAEGSETSQIEEISEFLEKVSQSIIKFDIRRDGEVSSAIGACAFSGKPGKQTATQAITPDCSRPEGCLFCDKYRVHSDIIDTRKLASCKYLLEHTASTLGGGNQDRNIVDLYIERIDVILSEIRKLHPQMVEFVIEDVEQRGELDNYWNGKLALLTELGILR